jgi:exodeoxyribonuclease-1
MSYHTKQSAPQATFYWYDLETFGLNSRSDRIAQFAGVRTDTELNVIGEPDEFFCQPVFDYLPDPQSILVTGITPEQCAQRGMKEAEFATAIQKQFSQPGTCISGYNNIRFDDEFMRFLFYRNLHDPYGWQWRNGNSRWDILDVVRATYALRPEGINWPRHEDGTPSFRLEDLTVANGLMHEAAHDAVSDVLATIALARLIKEKQPRLFAYFLKLRDKRQAQSLLDYQQLKPVVHVSGKIPAERGCLAVMLPLAPHPKNKNAVIAYDLSHDPQDLLTLDAEAIQERVFTRQDELAEGDARVPLKAIHSNKSPVLAPLGVLKGVDLQRLKLDWQTIKDNLEKIQQAPSLQAKLQQVFAPQEYPAPDVDEALYSGFISDTDRYRLDRLRENAPDSLRQPPPFEDSKLSELVWRYRARNWPDSLNGEETERWIKDSSERLQARHGPGLQEWQNKLAALQTESATDAKKQAVLQELARWFEHKRAQLMLDG